MIYHGDPVGADRWGIYLSDSSTEHTVIFLLNTQLCSEMAHALKGATVLEMSIELRMNPGSGQCRKTEWKRIVHQGHIIFQFYICDFHPRYPRHLLPQLFCS
jgi:hypothetical protein